MSVYPTGIVLGVALLVVVGELLRRHHLREKYAALWIVVALASVLLALVPKLLVGTADLLGFEVPANLLFLVGMIVLTTIAMQLSQEMGKVESEGQRLAEEIAILRMRMDALETREPSGSPGPQETGTPPERS